MLTIQRSVIFTVLLVIGSFAFSATLTSMTQLQIEQALVNKTLVSIPTDNLNGRDINNRFSMFMDGHGVIWGKMSFKPSNEPQADKGIYSIAKDGTFYITWQHWDGAKKLAGHIFETQNAYLAISNDGVFHTAYMKEAVQSGNHLDL